jgi:hypothetical protein
LRLRADALAQTRAPVGLLVLEGGDRSRPWLDAETVTWLGVGEGPGATGDVLTMSVRLRDVPSGSELRVGRMVVSTGAVRPLHLDGARALGRVFGTTTLEAFGGVPVVRNFDYRGFGWAAGGRVGQGLGDTALVGASYVQRRAGAQLADEEAGVDAAFTPTPWLTAAGRAAFDLVHAGPADALVSISAQRKASRVELFSTHRSAGRLLPSTSLFSVLGDYAATSAGATVRHRAFPRLELVGTASGQMQADEVGGQAIGRATLALDDEWAGTVGIELRRVDFGTARWAGARAIASLPLSVAVRLATELELVRPDDPRGRGVLWPWALVALAVRPAPRWDIACAVEASSGREYRHEAHALVRASYTFGASGERGL